MANSNDSKKVVAIIGNGFDLDLGLKTMYKDYFKSDYWPFKSSIYNENDGLTKYLNKKFKDNWNDLESLIYEYITQYASDNKQTEDIQCFNMIIPSLKNYLINQSNNYPPKHTHLKPYALEFIEELSKEDNFVIYSFNYTNLYRFCHTSGIDIDSSKIRYVHGTLKENNMILGTKCNPLIKGDYIICQKPFQVNYQGTSLRDDIENAEIVYIFGHSLGSNDKDYFDDFFNSIIDNIRSGKLSKLYIYTCDDDSEIAIKATLQNVYGINLTKLIGFTQFKIIKTFSGEVVI